MLKSLSMSKQRWFDIFIDFVVFLLSNNNLWDVICKNIIIVVDRLFKNMIYESINDLILEDVVKTFYRTMLFHWELSFIHIFDRDSQFVNYFWNQLCQRLNIKIKLFTIYHLETNDQIENTNDIMKQYLRAFCNYLQDDWIKWLSIINFIARNHYSKIIKCTLFFVNHDYHSRMRLKFSRELLEDSSRNDHERCQRLKVDFHVEKMNQINQKLRTQMIWTQDWHERYVNRYREHVLRRKVENKMWLDIRNLKTRRLVKKLFNKNEEFFEIIHVVSSHVYKLQLLDIWDCHDVFHIFFIHDDSHDSLSRQAFSKSLFIDRDSREDVFEIVKINDSQFVNDQLQYLVI